jgi:glycyl-tRNA synthetase beta chain
LPEATEAVSEEAKGPPEGAPDQAIDGFCRKNGVTREQLELREVKGRQTWFAVIDKPGRAVREVLAEAIPAIIRAFPWPKSMRWGAASISTESLRWVRPLSGIVAILGDDLVECEVEGIGSGYVTRGHRFHHPDEITIGGAHDYADKLRACHVLVDHEERQNIVREKAREAAAEAGLDLVEDEGLVIENAGLTEWPVPLLGRFDEEFLEVPPEVIQLTARVNQKYFVCEQGGRLANAFVCTANIEAADGGEAIVAGNRKVLAARLSDARFFWEQDLKTPLEEQAKKLERITFHEKLGTVADKVERVAKLARWLVEEGIVAGASADEAEVAARLCKADLVTEMVGEFPELQGLMGGYYARAEGLPEAVADAIRDHYKPVGQGDDVPTAPVTVAVSLADKLDTLVSFFAIDEKPTGSKDPFALRRATLGILSVLEKVGLRLPFDNAFLPHVCRLLWSEYRRLQRVEVARRIAELGPNPEADLLAMAAITVLPKDYGAETNDPDILLKFLNQAMKVDEGLFPSNCQISLDEFVGSAVASYFDLLDFFADRLKVQQREAGVRHDLIDAVFALGGEDDLVRLLARVHALQAFIGTEDGANLLAGYKRAANILKKEDFEASEGMQAPSYTPEPAEQALIDALDAAQPKAAAAIEAEDFAAAMAALASLRAPIDGFFEEVTVNDADPVKRDSRLALLDTFRAAVHNVADFSRIEG